LSKVAHGIACGMAYLHGIKPSAVLHRDLKSSNLLCDEAYQVLTKRRERRKERGEKRKGYVVNCVIRFSYY